MIENFGSVKDLHSGAIFRINSGARNKMGAPYLIFQIFGWGSHRVVETKQVSDLKAVLKFLIGKFKREIDSRYYTGDIFYVYLRIPDCASRVDQDIWNVSSKIFCCDLSFRV